jgi:predicted acylesterase/phospholipase RssA
LAVIFQMADQPKHNKAKRRKLRIISLASIPIIVVVILLFIPGETKEIVPEDVTPKPRSGTAVIITGAAARIPQEAALLEELYNRGLLKDLVFISGVSSGALNAVMLNGILSGKYTWKRYYQLLDSLTNNNIFMQEEKRIPVNTSPARELYTKVFEDELGYHSIGDLPYTTSISFTHLEALSLKKTVYRICSRKINEETDTTLSLVDVTMASSAFPVAFPPVRIRNVRTIPDVEYVDGGVGEDHVPYKALFEFEKNRGNGVEKVYIISRKSDNEPNISEELKGLGINDKGLFDKLGISFDNMLTKDIMKRIEDYATESPELIPLTYVWIPDFETDFLFFNFDQLGEQYTLTSQWAKTHDPVRLGDFLLPYLLKNK